MKSNKQFGNWPRWGLAILLLVASLLSGYGQTPRTNRNDKVYRDRVEPHWFSGSTQFWYQVDLPGQRREFIRVDAGKGTRQPAFDHQRMAGVLSKKTGKKIEGDQLPLTSLKFSEDGKFVTVNMEKETWRVDFNDYQLSEEKEAEPEKTEVPREERRRGRSRTGAGSKSPNGEWEVLVKDHDLYLKNLKTEAERQLTKEGDETNSFARQVQREQAVEMQYEARAPEKPSPEIYWASDSKWFVAMKTQAGTQRRVYLIESSPKDQLQPKLQSYPYLKPGDQVPIRKPHLFPVDGEEVKLDDTLFANPWSISDLRWHTNSTRFTFLFNQRGHQVLRVISVEMPKGDGGKPLTRPIIEESSETFVSYSGKFFCEYLDETGEIIWMSERDGWNHLFLYDAALGKVKNQVTKGEWVVRGVDRVDRDKRQIWFRAGGIIPGQDPYFIHHARINFDGSDLVVLTEGDGTHTLQFSPGREYFIDTWSRVDHPPVIELRRSSDGKRICRLEESDARELFETGWKAPESFVAKGRDGSTDIYGIIHRPKNFDPAKKYPVIEQIYAGPHDSFVPKSFRGSYRWERLAEKGFVIVQIDGMGTANRSKKFHDVCWKNLGDSGFPDRILWMKEAGKKYPWMDLERVGVYGGSAGGQSALRALLAHGDFYKAAAADCGCHDNRMDKIWWNEQWMGWPVGDHYLEQSNVTQAHKLKGHLLLTVGELDRNVDPASTMQVVNALIEADKDFELIVFPGKGHGAGGGPYGERRRNDFFARHLLK